MSSEIMSPFHFSCTTTIPSYLVSCFLPYLPYIPSPLSLLLRRFLFIVSPCLSCFFSFYFTPVKQPHALSIITRPFTQLNQGQAPTTRTKLPWTTFTQVQQLQGQDSNLSSGIDITHPPLHHHSQHNHPHQERTRHSLEHRQQQKRNPMAHPPPCYRHQLTRTSLLPFHKDGRLSKEMLPLPSRNHLSLEQQQRYLTRGKKRQ